MADTDMLMACRRMTRHATELMTRSLVELMPRHVVVLTNGAVRKWDTDQIIVMMTPPTWQGQVGVYSVDNVVADVWLEAWKELQ